MTTEGYQDFTCRLTRKNAQLVEVVFEDGSRVKCTPDHKFLINKGWVKAAYLTGEMCYNAISYSGDREWKEYRKQKSGLMDIFTPNSIITIEGLVNSYIERFGDSIMARYLQNTISTIKMGIQRIIPLKILNARKDRSIFQTTKKDMEEIQSGYTNHKEYGESQKRGRLSLVKWAKRMLTSCWMQPLQRFVINVGLNLQPQTWVGTGFAPITANQHGVEPVVLTMSRESVDIVGRSSLQTNIQRLKTAQDRVELEVLSVQKVSNSDVWCLSVPKTENFALFNGVIVHNCRYGIMSLRHAETEVTFFPEVKRRVGARNWTS